MMRMKDIDYVLSMSIINYSSNCVFKNELSWPPDRPSALGFSATRLRLVVTNLCIDLLQTRVAGVQPRGTEQTLALIQNEGLI